MGISKYLSCVSLPHAEKPYPAILDFLVLRFPFVGRPVWQQRIIQGKVLDEVTFPRNCGQSEKLLQQHQEDWHGFEEKTLFP